MADQNNNGWKNELGFADRLAVITQLASVLQTNENISKSEGLKNAQSLESEALFSALSLDEYTRLWSSKLKALKSSHLPSPEQEEDSQATDELRSRGGATIGAYTNVVPFASGLFSTIYKASPLPSVPSPTRYVALKETTPSIMKDPHNSKREARLLKVVKDHRHIIELLDSFSTPSLDFVLVFPFFPYNLGDLLDSGKITEMRGKEVACDIFSALAWVNGKGIIHRDVKPSNLLFAALEGRAVLADFGIAWSAADPSSEPAHKKITDIGTTCYRAPELLFGGHDYSEGVDLWAAGCVLAECIKSRNPPPSRGSGTEDDEKEGRTMFDAGDLGSELRLVASIFKELGTPTLEMWPEAARLPDFGKIQFVDFPSKSWDDLLPEATAGEKEIVSRLLVYESAKRLRAEEALKLSYFQGLRNVGD